MKKVIYSLIGILILLIVLTSYANFQYISFKNSIKQCMSKLGQKGQPMDFTFQSNPDLTLLKDFASRISTLPGINSVQVKSSKEVLEEFKERHKDNPTVLEALQDPESPITRDVFPPKLTIFINKESVDRTDYLVEEVKNEAIESKLSIKEITYNQINLDPDKQKIISFSFYWQLRLRGLLPETDKDGCPKRSQ